MAYKRILIKLASICSLVGGFNPSFKKKLSQNGNLPQIGVKIENI